MITDKRFAAMLVLVAILSGTAGFYLRWWLQQPTKEPTPQIIGSITPQLQLPDMDGVSQSLSQWQGSTILINFWATWCAPCREEVPALIELYNRYQDSGLQVIGIALDELHSVQSFADDFGINYQILIADPTAGMVIMESFANNTGALPYTIVIDHNGKVTEQHWGALNTHQAEAIVQPLLQAMP